MCVKCNGTGRVMSPDGPWTDECECQHSPQPDGDKKYIVVCYMRVIPDVPELMTRAEAKVEVEQLRLMQPENIYRIEDADDVVQ